MTLARNWQNDTGGIWIGESGEALSLLEKNLRSESKFLRSGEGKPGVERVLHPDRVFRDDRDLNFGD